MAVCARHISSMDGKTMLCCSRFSPIAASAPKSFPISGYVFSYQKLDETAAFNPRRQLWIWDAPITRTSRSAGMDCFDTECAGAGGVVAAFARRLAKDP